MSRYFYLSLVLLLASCKKPGPPPAPMPPPPPVVVEPTPEPEPEPIQVILQNFERVYFDYDSTRLSDDSLNALKENAHLLTEFSGIRVEVQGHSDERGTTEYNLALGQKRAQAIADRLVAMGAPRAVLSIVSYGEERPLAAGETETVWSQNRRAEFRVLSGADPAALQGSIH